MGNFDDDALYPNQPLTDVACEVRFAGEMQVECERYRFWDDIRAAYPNVLVPLANDGQPLALQHYRFRADDGVRTVSVALNSFAFSESKYSGHKSFIAEFERLIGIFRKTYPRLGKIKRIGWRYINVIPYSRENELVPLRRYLKLEIPLPSKIFDHTSAIDLSWTGKCFDGEVVLHINSLEKKQSKQEGLLVDIDYGQTREGMGWADVVTILKDARSKCRGIFEDLITDDYRQYLKGETV